MLFRQRHKPLPPMTEPAIDSAIHWLASRGLTIRADVSRQDWIAAAADPTDPISLAEARIDGEPCVEPTPSVTITAVQISAAVDELADGLDLPIDDVHVGAVLSIRSGTTTHTFEINGRTDDDVLLEIVRAFTDSAHVALRRGRTFAIVHRDIAQQAEGVFRER